MGGCGSGRPAERDTVEGYPFLDINLLSSGGYIKKDCHTACILRYSFFDELVARIIFEGHLDKTLPFIQLRYTYNSDEQLDYRVYLTTTPVHFGGHRWWFVCPNNKCYKRVGKLYCAGKYFLCRHCYNLTYQSCRDSHQLDRLIASIYAAVS